MVSFTTKSGKKVSFKAKPYKPKAYKPKTYSPSRIAKSRKKAKVYKGEAAKKSMAKRKAPRRRSAPRAKSRRRSAPKNKANMTSIISTIVYGIARRPVAKKILPKLAVNGKLPLGDYTNEALFGGAAYILPHVIKGKQTRDVCAPIQTIELASAAEQAFIDITEKGTSGTTGQTGYVN